MGQGGYITLVNGTSQTWTKTHQHSYQMNAWSFPDVITAYSTHKVYVEWEETIFKHRKDDSGEARYAIGTTGHIFEIQARAKEGYNLQIFFQNLTTPTIASGSTVSLGWVHDGSVQFILEGEPGAYFSSVDNKAANWMQRNLNRWGSRKLKNFCLPGSHDAGMSALGNSTAGSHECNTLTQAFNIKKQLELGVRFFDIRPVISGGRYVTGHYGQLTGDLWLGGNGEPIANIIKGINDFLDHNKELVIIKLSHTLNTDIGFGKYRSFTQEEWDKLLDEMTGLKNRYKVEGTPKTDLTNLPLESFIKGNKAAVLIIIDENVKTVKHWGDGFYRLSESFDIYDEYSETNDVDKMVKDQLKKMKTQTGFFLLSWTLTQSKDQAVTCMITNSNSIKSLAARANQVLPEKLYPEVHGSSFPNIIYTDYIVNTMPVALAMAINGKPT